MKNAIAIFFGMSLLVSCGSPPKRVAVLAKGSSSRSPNSGSASPTIDSIAPEAASATPPPNAQNEFLNICADPGDVELSYTLVALRDALQAQDCPALLKALEQASDLDLNGRRLYDIEPLRFAKNLIRLDLRNNNIRDVSVLSNLTQLRFLDLSSNSVSDISSLGQAVLIVEIGLSDNAIKDLTPLAGMKNLKLLKASGNAISDISPLSALNNLETVSLHTNLFSKLDPLLSSPRIKDLNLQNMESLGDGAALEKLSALEVLDLQGTKINDFAFLKELTALRELKVLLESRVDTGVFKSLQNLELLEFEFFVDPFAADESGGDPLDYSFLAAMPKLKSLEISDPTLDSLDFLNGHESLQSLALLTDEIDDLRPISRLSQLRNLTMQLSFASDGSFLLPLKSLESLKISDAALDSLSFVTSLPQLKTLLMSGVLVDDFSPLASAPQLNVLGLESMAIGSIDFLKGLPKLQRLSLSFNELSDLSAIGTLKELLTLDLSLNANPLDLGPLQGLSKLEDLNVNFAPSVKFAGIQRLQNIKTIEASGLGLSDCSFLADFRRLNFVNLNSNELKDLDCLSGLPELNFVDVGENKGLTDLAPLAGAKELEVLFAYGSGISSIDPLRDLIFLGFINLSDTKLASVEALSQSKRLKSLLLDNTPAGDAVNKTQPVCSKDAQSQVLKNFCGLKL